MKHKNLFIFIIFMLGLHINIKLVMAQEIEPIELITKEISGGNTHSYKLNVLVKSHVNVTVVQKRIDLGISLVKGDELISYINSSANINSIERINDCLEPGEYTIKIGSEDQFAPTGSYNIETVGLKPFSVEGSLLISAREKFMEGKRLLNSENYDIDEVIKLYHRAASIYKEIDRERAADIFSAIADVCLINKHNDKYINQAFEYYTKSLESYRMVGNVYGEGNATHNLGYVSKLKANYDKALQYYNESFAISRNILQDEYEAQIANANIAGVYIEQENFDEALKLYDTALKYFYENKFFNICGIFGKKIAEVYRKKGEVSKLLEVYNNQIDYYTKCNNEQELADHFSYKADLLKTLFNKEDSLENYEKAIKIYRKSKKMLYEGIIINNIASLHEQYGEIYTSIEYYKKALEIFKNLNNDQYSILALSNLGLAQTYIGDYESSLNKLKMALDICNKVSNSSNFIVEKAYVLSNLAAVYTEVGDTETSLQLFNESLAIFRNNKLGRNEATVLSNMGRLLFSVGKAEEARENFQLSLKIFDRVGSKKGKSVVLTKLGEIETHFNNYKEAERLLIEATRLRDELKDELGQIYSQNLLAYIYNLTGKSDQANRIYDNCLTLSETLVDKNPRLFTIYNLALFHKKHNNYLKSLDLLNDGIGIIEGRRSSLRSDEFKSNFLANHHKFYELYISVLMGLHEKDPLGGYDIQAFEFSEKSRARLLLDTITNINPERYSGISKEVINKYDDTESRLSYLSQQIIKLKNKDGINNVILENMEKDFIKTKLDLEILKTQITKKSNNNSFLKLSDIQKIILDKDTCLLQYIVGEESSYAWLVTTDSIFSYILPNKKSIEELIKQNVDAINRVEQENARMPIYEPPIEKKQRLNEVENALNNANKTLADAILTPILAQINKKAKVLISANGVLDSVSFASLPNINNTPLVVTHKILNIPSMSTIELMRGNKRFQNDSILVVADPIFSANDLRVNARFKNENPTENLISYQRSRGAKTLDRLPGTEKEGRAIVRLFRGQSELLIGEFATVENLKNRNLMKYGYLHMSSHTLKDFTYPELTSIVLSLVDRNQNELDGFLTVRDILRLTTSAKLVTLSACQTGLGKERAGEENFGLATAFLYSGSSAVLSTLWNVNDKATAEFMTYFYKLLKHGVQPSVALQKTQIKIMKTKGFESPYYWGGFQLKGDIK
ncbi:MAG: CHAT domain-containing protein [Blastocatellia bacterium]